MFFHRVKTCLSIFFRLFRVSLQVVYGAWRLSKMKGPFVSIFGGAKLSQESPYAHKANKLAQRLVEQNISVVTGGGSGVMYAANCGAIKPRNGGNGKSIGIGVKGLDNPKNPCVNEYFEIDYFFARKWLLTRFSEAFIIFPGGFGTMDELTEVLTLIQTKRMKRIPIVLVGTDYWRLFMQWVSDSAFKNDLIKKEDLKLFTVTDDLEKVFCIARDECEMSSV